MKSLLGPRALFAAGVVAVVILLTSIVVVVLQERRDCQGRVETRVDQRAMWLFALEQSPNPLDPRTLAFRAALDDRIPELRCEGWLAVHPEPIGDDD